MIDPILIKVRQKITFDNLSLQEAAAKIGIGASSLERHLAGDYVRSDSLAKYRMWLEGSQLSKSAPSILELQVRPVDSALYPKPPIKGLELATLKPVKPLNVVDLFCGCGGMSLGFERLKGGEVYRVAMALDIEAPMVRVFNDNHPSPSGDLPIARLSDISDFMSEAEIQGYYLDHLARSTDDKELKTALSNVGRGGIHGLRKTLHDLDHKFLEELKNYRADQGYISAVRSLGSVVLGQTSVSGFHNATKLPSSGTGVPKAGPLIWHNDGEVPESAESSNFLLDDKVLKFCRAEMLKLWNSEVEKLSSRAGGAGRGQLASAAERIEKFLGFLESSIMRKIKTLWINWRAEREAHRRSFFESSVVKTNLQSIYDDGKQVTVLLGGPPCQGFSRIGRGKIRSLREQSVHVHEDVDSVDSRNQLMHQYVLFVAALAPKVFLFENVRHFQAVVKSDGIEFDAADILAEAIESVSSKGLGYAVSRRIVVASQHAVPQARERFVMSGVRKDISSSLSSAEAATWCLALPKREPVPLQIALEGLPEPEFSNSGQPNKLSSIGSNRKEPSEVDGASDLFRNWIYQGDSIDAHLARPPRRDDAAFFSLMGPGKRWMDYRCDDSPTITQLSTMLGKIQSALNEFPELSERLGVTLDEIQKASAVTDGSLSLRLILENIAPQAGELQHHLLTTTYLRKREGAHGDWLSRMDPSVPSKTIVSHMAKDTYAFVHPFLARTLSVREAARVQSFPDDYRFGSVGLVDGFRVVGNAVPPLLSFQFAERVSQVLSHTESYQKKSKEKLASDTSE